MEPVRDPSEQLHNGETFNMHQLRGGRREQLQTDHRRCYQRISQGELHAAPQNEDICFRSEVEPVAANRSKKGGMCDTKKEGKSNLSGFVAQTNFYFFIQLSLDQYRKRVSLTPTTPTFTDESSILSSPAFDPAVITALIS